MGLSAGLDYIGAYDLPIGRVLSLKNIQLISSGHAKRKKSHKEESVDFWEALARN